MSHTTVVHDMLRALNRMPGVRFWKNPVGHGYTEQGDPIAYGLSKGSSDLIGLVDGRFCGLEVKTGSGRESSEQTAFREAIKRLGGFAAVVHSIDEAVAAVGRAREGMAA